MMLLGSMVPSLFLLGCAGASVSNVRTPLNVGAVARSESLLVKPAASENTVFLGDFSDDPASVSSGREKLRATFATKAVAAIRAAGLQADLYPASGSATATAIVVELVVKKFDAGSNAARAIVGFGAGASFLITDVKLIKGGATIADFSLDASSGGRGGFSAIGSWLDNHIDDSVHILVNYLSQNIQ